MEYLNKEKIEELLNKDSKHKYRVNLSLNYCCVDVSDELYFSVKIPEDRLEESLVEVIKEREKDVGLLPPNKRIQN